MGRGRGFSPGGRGFRPGALTGNPLRSRVTAYAPSAAPPPCAAGGRYNRVVTGDDDSLAREIDALIDAHRTQCLWFLRPDWYPTTPGARVRALEHLSRHGDRATAQRAGELRQWLLRRSSAGSAAS